MSRIRRALSVEELKEIQARNTSPDMLALLWEVRRLRKIAATADELDRSLGPPVGMPGLLRALLRVQLDGGNCVVMQLPPTTPE